MSPICTHCAKEMRCDKNGVVVHITNHIVVHGDAYKCDNCGARVVCKFGESYHANYETLSVQPGTEVIDLQ